VCLFCKYQELGGAVADLCFVIKNNKNQRVLAKNSIIELIHAHEDCGLKQ
jgi:hypothetical protein